MLFRLLHTITLLVFAALTNLSYASECQTQIQIGIQASSSWHSGCASEHRLRYDPYNTNAEYPARYFEFTLPRDADIRISVNSNYYDRGTQIFLLDGNTPQSNVLQETFGNELKTRLNAGTYLIEATNRYTNISFTAQVEYNDIGSAQCVQPITFGQEVRDGWIPACQSSTRDIEDPYNNIPGEGHRSRFYTFSLDEAADIRAVISSDVDTHSYILQGHDEFGIPLAEFASNTFDHHLPAGDYTLELTTARRYDPGKFAVTLSKFTNTNGCDQQLILNSNVSGTWSANCEIRSWIDGNGNPYQGGTGSPERANYYSFTVTETSDIQFSLAGNTSAYTVMNIYENNSYIQRVASNLNRSPYGPRRPNPTLNTTLQPGVYELEITQTGRIASGNYSFSSTIFSRNCTSDINLNTSSQGYLSDSCISSYRGQYADGNSDPYTSGQSGTYYAKRFRFNLNKPEHIRLNANSSNRALYLYIFKEENGLIHEQPVTESVIDYWRSTHTPSLNLELDAGSYIAEVVTHDPGYRTAFNISLQTSDAQTCTSFLRLNQRRSHDLNNSSCKSLNKRSYYNYDPYNGSGFLNYYARNYRILIDQAGQYDFITDSDHVNTHLFLKRGTTGRNPVANKSVFSVENRMTTYLEPGVYNLEVTSTEPNDRGSFEVTVWDKSSPVIEYRPLPCSREISLITGTQQFSERFSDVCTRRSQDNGITDYFSSLMFNVETIADVNIAATSQSEIQLKLFKNENFQWTEIRHSIPRHSQSVNLNHLVLRKGYYRAEVLTTNVIGSGDITFTLNNDIDSDGDFIVDSKDDFPNDSGEWVDTDNDGIGNNSDHDDDNDNISDAYDNFPLDANESRDSDGDGIGDIADPTPWPDDGDILITDIASVTTESSGRVSVSLERRGSTNPVRIQYFTYDKTAIAGKDYLPDANIISFAQDEMFATVDITISDNSVHEADRSFAVRFIPLTSDVSFSNGDEVNITIQDDDTAAGDIYFEQSNIRVSEDDGTVNIALVRDGDLSEAVTAYYVTQEGTARDSSDFSYTVGKLNFATGERRQEIQIPLISSGEQEPDESFSVTLLDLNGKMGSRASTTEVTIQGELGQAEPVFSFSENKLFTDEDSGVKKILVRRLPEHSSNADIVHWRVINDRRRGSVTFSPGQTSAAILLKIDDDSFYSAIPSEIEVTLSGTESGASYSHQAATVVMIEDEQTPSSATLIFPSANYPVYEGDTADIYALRLFDTNETQSYELSVTTPGFGPESPTILSFIENIHGSLSFESGETVAHISVPTRDDQIFHADKSILFSTSTPEAAGNRGTIMYIIDSKDGLESGGVRFADRSITVSETAGSVSVPLRRLTAGDLETLLAFTYRDDTALQDVNYESTETRLEMEHDAYTAMLNIPILNTGPGDGDKTFYVDLNVAFLNSESYAMDTIQINIIDSEADTSPALPTSEKKSKKDNGFLSLGVINHWMLLLLIIPLLFSRIRILRK